MIRLMVGSAAIVLALFAIFVGFVPGAASIAGLAISILAVVVSLFSIKNGGQIYFRVTLGMSLIGMLLVNDVTRIWQPIPLPFSIRIGLYSVFILAFAGCCVAAYRLGSTQDRPGKHIKSG